MIAIIHLSDIHLKNGVNAIANKIGSLTGIIAHETSGCTGVFIAITGDVAYSGAEDEYDIARTLLKRLKAMLLQQRVNVVGTLLVPGNHDNEVLGKDLDARDMVISVVLTKQPDSVKSSIISQCCEVQASYRHFEDEIVETLPVVAVDTLYKQYRFSVGDNTIAFHCINTAWLSVQHEISGNLHFPVGMANSALAADESNYAIVLMHHPFNWHRGNNYHVLRRAITSVADLVLTGHQHEKHISASMTEDNDQSLILEAYELQNSSDNMRSGFSIVFADVAKNQHKSKWYQWDTDAYLVDLETEYSSVRRVGIRGTGHFGLKSDFASILHDAGAPFQHPSGTDFQLHDIYVYPELRKLRLSDSEDHNGLHDIVSTEVLFTEGTSPVKALVLGPEHSGKTTMCRRLFAHYYDIGLVPILVKGSDFSSTAHDSIERVIQRCASNQYDESSLLKLNNLTYDNFFLIVEDAHLIRAVTADRKVIIGHLRDRYENLVVTADSLFPVRELVGTDNDTSVSGFDHFEILEFGHACRHKLIHRWLSIGSRHYQDSVEYHQRFDNINSVLEGMVRRNLVPGYPLFLLTIIQSVEGSRRHDLRDSAQAEFYSMLITHALHQHVSANITVPDLISYCTELSATIFQAKISVMTNSEYTTFHADYNARIRVNWDVSMTQNTLLKSGVLVENEAGIRFRYKFIYLFFLARHLSRNINDISIKDVICKMCDRLYVEDFANTVLLLTHFDRADWIIDELLGRAEAIFSGIEPIRISTDFTAINNLLAEIPQLVLDEKATDRYRDNQAKHRDEVARSNGEQKDESDELVDIDRPVDGQDIFAAFASSLRIVEILGQLMTNFAGSLDGKTKQRIGRTIYGLGLRSMNSVILEIGRDPVALIEEVRQNLEQQKEATSAESEAVARKFVFGVSGMIVYGILRRLQRLCLTNALHPRLRILSQMPVSGFQEQSLH